jgi:hypothetical protein
MASNAPCFYQAFLALTLLNVRAKALLRSFLALVIRLLLPGWPLIDLITSAVVLALLFVLRWEHVTSTLHVFLRSGFAREKAWIDAT